MSAPIMNPGKIAENSFSIIQRELDEQKIELGPDQAPIIQRMVHSTADFDFARITHFSPHAIESGIDALHRGCPIVTDVNMIRMGISAPRVAALGGSLHCFVAEPDARAYAESNATTRSAAGIRLAAAQDLLEGAIVVVGNAPTALYEIITLSEDGPKPSLVIGVPVGFVGAVESKDLLMVQNNLNWIATKGRKGGSPVAVAIVNALLRLAVDEEAAVVD